MQDSYLIFVIKVQEEKRKKLENKKNLTVIDKKVIIDNHILDEEDAHPRRPRAKYFGELIQMDASRYLWFNNKLTTLHLAIDDSTGAVVGAYFDNQETLQGYYNVFYQILKRYGIPYKFFTDNHTIFTHNSFEYVTCKNNNNILSYAYKGVNLFIYKTTDSFIYRIHITLLLQN